MKKQKNKKMTCLICALEKIHFHVKITDRWSGVASHISSTSPDLAEMDGEYYALVEANITNAQIELNYKTGVYQSMWTLENVKKHGPDYVKMIECECGGNKLYSMHSLDCDKI